MSVPTKPGFAMPRHQAGNSLIIVLVVLTLLSLAGFGAMRSADTGNVISGNFAFQQAATQASDRAVTDALNALAVIAAGGAGNNDVPNRYAAVRTNTLDARGVPTTINWGSVACTNEAGVAVANCDTDNGNFRIQYFVERLCSAAPDMTVISDIRAKCEFEPGPGANAATATPATIPLRYRVLIRVRGPRGTEGWYEALLSGPATV
jgi:type IV pilus assembly protein PilX